MRSATLHYIYDPLCGWCYAAAPLVEAASQLVPIELHGGGMMTGTRRQKITPAWRDYVRPQDRQIGKATGQHFGKGYLEGLLEDQSAVLDSGPPTAAILAAQALSGAGLEMLALLHEAHYVEGRRIAEEQVLVEIAEAVGLDRTPFLTALRATSGKTLEAHFMESRRLLSASGGTGFPTFILERDGALQRLEHGHFLGRPAAWHEALTTNLPHLEPAAVGTAIECGPDGCLL